MIKLKPRILPNHTNADAKKLLAKIGANSLGKTIRRMRRIDNESCKKGDHGIHLRHTGFSGGRIYYQCNNCGASISNPDLPVTI